ncbi:hypothetical protein PF010_g28523 [Phytophthora fragariae]|uniref:Retrotransposon gag domain-containing protein n=1 Tax=Phytophthora fragariae TaxID=53985 RepID=A0A6A3HB21_9STRA|nr:hypothetical protein PF003_g28782 [Phytophthora fragariae]KAE8966332.1 hypothetical protein PF011_g27973 [Phytophthora fragariae]KAE9064659.1 hypothetical protein PF010_g28523 [Phytophthora fragariae]KAE9073984.1 hypothetical protein PF006_g28623 [Phytophthora fragariae]KAE9239302.1 hypothetical protein PF002_g10359 [Phytophthora fragariae]
MMQATTLNSATTTSITGVTTVKDQIRRLSYDDDKRDDTKYLEIRTHFSLDKIAEFDGKRYCSDASLQWLKRFIFEMKGTRMPQNSWCEPFSLSLGRAAKSWYRQLPKKTQQRWNLLNEAFLDYYCSQFDQSARTGYYSASRKENEPICDFLIRLNGYARTAKIQYEKGGADASDHVEQFLLNCGDDEVMDLLYPLQLADIQRVEQIINKKILGEKRKKQRDRMVSNRTRDTRRSDNSRRGESRRDDRRIRRDDSRDRRVAVAETSVDDLYHGVDSRQPSRRNNALGSSSSAGSSSEYSDSESDQDQNYVDAGAGSERTSGPSNSAERRRDDRPSRRGDSGERPRYGPCAACGGANHSAHFCNRRCKFCKQVHDVGRCEMFQRFEKLTKFVRTSVDKSTVPADLQAIYEPKNLN